MNQQEIQYIAYIIVGLAGLGSLIILPKVRTLIVSMIGEKNANYLRDFVEDEIKLHPEFLNETNIDKLLELANDKFGDKLSADAIERIVKAILALLRNN